MRNDEELDEKLSGEEQRGSTDVVVVWMTLVPERETPPGDRVDSTFLAQQDDNLLVVKIYDLNM